MHENKATGKHFFHDSLFVLMAIHMHNKNIEETFFHVALFEARGLDIGYVNKGI